MAFKCDNCGRTANRGHLVSHAKNRVNHTRKPNLHSAFVLINGKKVRQTLCTKCLRKAVRPHKVKLAEKKQVIGDGKALGV